MSVGEEQTLVMTAMIDKEDLIVQVLMEELSNTKTRKDMCANGVPMDPSDTVPYLNQTMLALRHVIMLYDPSYEDNIRSIILGGPTEVTYRPADIDADLYDNIDPEEI